jgi:predicted alpha/beta hydrolase
MVSVEPLSLLTSDGLRLPATLYRAPSPRAVVVLAGGTGIPHGFYRHFARGLSEHGLTVLSFDYRGLAHTGVPLRMADWGRRDLDAALQQGSALAGALPLLFVGHSVGGQLFGLAEHASHVRAALLIASQSGYWRLWPGGWRWRRWLDWHLIMPLAIRFTGTLPGALMGGATLPGGIAREWVRWCRTPHYLCEQDGTPMRDHFARLRLPMRFYHITDDDAVAPLAAVRALMEFYPVAGKELRQWSPAQWGVKTLGHVGVFRPAASAAWGEIVGWLLGQIPVTTRCMAENRMAEAHTGFDIYT